MEVAAKAKRLEPNLGDAKTVAGARGCRSRWGRWLVCGVKKPPPARRMALQNPPGHLSAPWKAPLCGESGGEDVGEDRPTVRGARGTVKSRPFRGTEKLGMSVAALGTGTLRIRG